MCVCVFCGNLNFNQVPVLLRSPASQILSILCFYYTRLKECVHLQNTNTKQCVRGEKEKRKEACAILDGQTDGQTEHT